MRPGSHVGVLRNHDGLQWLREDIKLQREPEKDPFLGLQTSEGWGWGFGVVPVFV